jgi:hypothetical protein
MVAFQQFPLWTISKVPPQYFKHFFKHNFPKVATLGKFFAKAEIARSA